MTRIPFTDTITILPDSEIGCDALEFVDDAGCGTVLISVPIKWSNGKIVRLEYLPAHFMLPRLQPDEVKRIETILNNLDRLF